MTWREGNKCWKIFFRNFRKSGNTLNRLVNCKVIINFNLLYFLNPFRIPIVSPKNVSEATAAPTTGTYT